MPFNATLAKQLRARFPETGNFAQRDLAQFATAEEAYHQLMIDIIAQQRHASMLVLNGGDVQNIFVDGGFSNNALYMHLLAEIFPGKKIFAADVAQASAIGAAMAVHECWNTQPLPGHLVSLRAYS